MNRLQTIADYWSGQATGFDEEPDHGLTDPIVRAAWARRMAEWIPPEAVKVADLGCGTGSISLMLAEAGLQVVGVDLSPAMLEQAHRKASAANLPVELLLGDAANPGLADGSFDVVVARHLIWALIDPIAALARWSRLLTQEGRLVLIEGHWFDPAKDSATDPAALPWDGGVIAAELVAALSPLFDRVEHHPLSNEPALWGRSVTDERYAVVASRRRQ